MLTVALDHTIIDVNEQMASLTGYGREQLIGSDFKGYFIEPGRAGTGVQQTLTDGFVTNYELLLRSRHRREILVSFNASVFKDTNGIIQGIFAVARDVTEQRRLEQQLHETQNYNRGLIESFVDALVTVDPDYTITDVNEQMIKLTGFLREDLVGSTFKDYFTEPDRAEAGVRQTLEQGSVKNYELNLKSRIGKRTVVSFNAGTFKDTNGKVAGILAAARDITIEKKLEDQLHEQQNYNRSLIESNIYALLIVDPHWVITDVNEQTARLTGYNRKQLIGSPFVDYFTDPDRAKAGAKTTFDEGVITNYELVVRSKSGKKVSVSLNAAVLRDTAGVIVGILAAAREITEQKKIEQALRDQQIYTRSLIESNIDAIMTTDTLGIITDVNRQMCDVTGRTHEELVGTPFKQYFTDVQLAEDGIRKVLAEDRVTNYELTIQGKDGKPTLVSYNAATFKSADGRLRGVFAAARDITDQKRLEEQLRNKNEELQEKNSRVQEATRLKSEFLANMSHELRTPLNGVIGFAELMHDEKVGPISPNHKEYLGDILTSSRHLLQLINDILDLAKVESGKMEFHPESLDMEKIVNEVRDVIRTLAATKQIRIETYIDPQLGKVVVDPGKLKQILYNYLSNAIKFTPDGGSVSIRVALEENDYIRLEVEDSGIGIKPEDVARLFIEFQQLDASVAKKYQGTGLGLALTRRIVEAQGGKVGVRSKSGKGSIFYATFPRILEAQVIREWTESEPLTLAPHAQTILVIEDDPKDQKILAQTLGQAGFAVKMAKNGMEALELCRKHTFAAITLDLLLPDVSAIEILRQMKIEGLNQKAPVIVITVVAEKGATAGYPVHDLILKPLDPQQLLKSLEGAGVTAEEHRNILVVDDDPISLKLMKTNLAELGFKVICKEDGESALKSVEDEPPSVIILDLLMPKMDGFTFLTQLRKTRIGKEIPVIVWTSKDLTKEDRERLKKTAHAITLKNKTEVTSLIDELRAHLIYQPGEQKVLTPGRKVAA